MIAQCSTPLMGRDFTQTDIIDDFYHSLESSLEGKSGEGAIYMGEL